MQYGFKERGLLYQVFHVVELVRKTSLVYTRMELVKFDFVGALLDWIGFVSYWIR